MNASFVVETAGPKTAVLRIGDSLDFRTVEDFKTICQGLLESGTVTFLLDVSRTAILDSSGLGALFGLLRKLSPLGGEILIAAPSRPVQTVFQMTRTYKIFRQFPTVDAAREALSSERLSRTTVA